MSNDSLDNKCQIKRLKTQRNVHSTMRMMSKFAGKNHLSPPHTQQFIEASNINSN